MTIPVQGQSVCHVTVIKPGEKKKNQIITKRDLNPIRSDRVRCYQKREVQTRTAQLLVCIEVSVEEGKPLARKNSGKETQPRVIGFSSLVAVKTGDPNEMDLFLSENSVAENQRRGTIKAGNKNSEAQFGGIKN